MYNYRIMENAIASFLILKKSILIGKQKGHLNGLLNRKIERRYLEATCYYELHIQNYSYKATTFCIM